MFYPLTSKWPKTDPSIIQLTTGANTGYGSRTCGIWGSQGNFIIYSSINSHGRHGYYYETATKYSLNEWWNIKVSQARTSKSVVFLVAINDSVVHEVVNKDPREFHNVKCYISSPWYDAQPGYVRIVRLDISN